MSVWFACRGLYSGLTGQSLDGFRPVLPYAAAGNGRASSSHQPPPGNAPSHLAMPQLAPMPPPGPVRPARQPAAAVFRQDAAATTLSQRPARRPVGADPPHPGSLARRPGRDPPPHPRPARADGRHPLRRPHRHPLALPVARRPALAERLRPPSPNGRPTASSTSSPGSSAAWSARPKATTPSPAPACSTPRR